jgi:hypothetical protein
MDPVYHRLALDSSEEDSSEEDSSGEDSSEEDSSAARDHWGCFAGDSLVVGTVAHLQ